MVKALTLEEYPYYYFTDTGEVYSRISNRYHNKNGRIKKRVQIKDKDGYLRVSLFDKKGKQKSVPVHRLVAMAFIPNLENKPVVNHKNGIKTDNRVENLEWMTISENTKHAYRILGVKPNKTNLGKKGKLCQYAKKIQQIKNGNIINEFYGAAEAERKTGINQTHIRDCLGKQEKHVVDTNGNMYKDRRNRINRVGTKGEVIGSNVLSFWFRNTKRKI